MKEKPQEAWIRKSVRGCVDVSDESEGLLLHGSEFLAAPSQIFEKYENQETEAKQEPFAKIHVTKILITT